MTDGFSIREAEARDCAALAKLHAACFAEAWNENSLCNLLASGNVFGLLGEAGGTIHGFIVARTAAGEAEILTLAVAQAARRGGIGRALVIAVGGHAQQQAREIFLEVADNNLAARALYEDLGFAQVGRRPAYYAHARGREDAFILRATLPLAPARDRR